MPWDKSSDAPVILFECDTCEEPTFSAYTCNVEQIRATAKDPEPHTSDFAMCWRFMQGVGWRSFKRTGHPWTYHCVKCGPTAEVAHNEHKRQEAQRDRLKIRNARD